MNKKPKKTTTLNVIEINDSSDDESAETSDSNIIPKPKAQQPKPAALPTPDTTTKQTNATQKEPLPCSSSSESKEKSNESDIPKKITSRRKSVHRSIRSTENFSFESYDQTTSRESFDDCSSNLNKKKRSNDIPTEDPVESAKFDDPEIEQMLKKIAYCRIFTNYLLRQYDMLAIDFKLYSNLDLLNLDLNMRVDTYTAIRKSRQRFREALEMNNGQVQL